MMFGGTVGGESAAFGAQDEEMDMDASKGSKIKKPKKKKRKDKLKNQ